MRVVEIDLISVWGIEIELISVMGSELTWFLCVDRKILGFSVWIEITWCDVGASQFTSF